MLSIPLYGILIFYALILLMLAIFFLVNFFHIILTGTTTFTSLLMTLFVIIFATAVLLGAWYLLKNLEWGNFITIWNNDWFGGIFGSKNIL